VPRDASGYGDLVAALNKITTPRNVRKITGGKLAARAGEGKAV
jgi:hypothetical protein